MSARIRSFRELEVWQLAMVLAEESHRLAGLFPLDERFGLAAQVRRASVSVPSNVAEGHNRRSRPAYRNHVAIALGSIAELDTQLELAFRFHYFEPATWESVRARLNEVGRLLHGLFRALDKPAV